MLNQRDIVAENTKESRRLGVLTSGLGERELGLKLPNGWTVAVTLAHLAFWDLRQVTLLRRWMEGVPPGSLDAEAINGPLAEVSTAIPPKATVKLALDAAEAIDGEVEKLTPAQVEELLKLGLERNLRRAAHRKEHLDKVETALRKNSSG